MVYNSILKEGRNIDWGCLRTGCWGRIFWPKRDEMTGEWSKLHNEELHDLYYLPSIIRIMKSRRMRLPGNVVRMGEKRNAYRLLVESQREGVQ
jgi:hypothetical protein